jgi:hypothetical protein
VTIELDRMDDEEAVNRGAASDMLL